ncbi:hypothetical protein [Pantoea dispersa]|uniref:hypothetical protein n=1 Tax=Pantoea dispersa TaxID=59814 RepID=UPI001331B089|nr:hypothetical protein [Pantoea dispersa]
MNFNKVSALMMCVAVTSCSGGKVLFNEQDPNSGFTKTTKLELVYDSNPDCKLFTSPTSLGGVDLALAVGAIGYNLVNREVNSWIADEIAKYTYSYTTMTNYYPNSIKEGEPYQEMCFTLNRKVKIDGGADIDAFTFDINFVRFEESKSFITLIRNVRMYKAGALTTKSEGLELLISVTLSTFTPNSSEPKILTTSNIPLSNVNIIKKDESFDNETAFEGKVFNPIPNGTPVTLTVAITEKGLGVKNLTDFQTDLKNNSESAKALLDLGIKNHFKE